MLKPDVYKRRQAITRLLHQFGPMSTWELAVKFRRYHIGGYRFWTPDLLYRDLMAMSRDGKLTRETKYLTHFYSLKGSQ